MLNYHKNNLKKRKFLPYHTILVFFAILGCYLLFNVIVYPNDIFSQNQNPNKWSGATISLLSSWNYESLDANLDKLRLEALDLTVDGIYYKAKDSWKELASKTENNYGPEDSRTIGANVRLTYILMLSGEYENAIKLAEKIAPNIILLFGEDSIEHILVMEAVGLANKHLQEFERAKNILEQNTASCMHLFGDNSRETLSAKTKLSEILPLTGQVELAEQNLREVKSAQESQFGANDPDTLDTSLALAILLFNKNEIEESKKLAEDIFPIAKQIYGDTHPFISQIVSLEAFIEYSQGNIEKSLTLLMQVANIESQTYGVDHPWYWNTIAYMANLYGKQEDYEKAIELLQTVIDARERILGSLNPDTISAKYELADIYLLLQDYAKAISLYNDVIEAYQGGLGDKHQETLVILQKLISAKFYQARNYQLLVEFEKAISLYNEVIELEAVNVVKREFTMSAKINLADIYNSLGKFDMAIALYKEIIDEAEKAQNSNFHDIIIYKRSLADAYESNGDYELAKSLYIEVLLVMEQEFGPDDPKTLKTKHNLAFTYYKLGDYAQAEKLYNEVLEDQVRVLGPDDPNTALTAFNLGYLHYQNKNLELAIFYTKIAVKSTQLNRISNYNLSKNLQEKYAKKLEYRYHFLVTLLTEAGRIQEAQEVISLIKMEEIENINATLEKFAPDIIDGERQLHEMYEALSEYDDSNESGEIPYFLLYPDREAFLAQYTMENLFRDTPEGPAIDRFFNITNSLASLALERRSLINKMSTGGTLTDNETQRLEVLDVEIEAANSIFWDFCYDELPTILVEAKNVDSDKIENLISLQETLLNLGPATVLIHTVASDEKLYLFLTTPDLLIVAKSEISRIQLTTKIQEFYALLNNPQLDPRDMAKELYDLIIAPISSELEGAKAETIMFSLDGPLRYIPMSALYDGEKWLVEKYSIALFVDAARDKLKDQPILTPLANGFGVTKAFQNYPALDGVLDELNAIIINDDVQTGLLNGNIYLDTDFTKDTLKDGLRSGASVIHIASHFQFVMPDDVSRDNSYLLLGNGEFLTIANIRREMDFKKLDLLTLSACNTGSGIISGNGIEVESFGALAQKLGAKAVLATLWPVNDTSTGILMSNFYRIRYEGNTMDKASALRLAQIELMSERSNAQPNKRGIVLASFESIKMPAAKPWEGKGFSHPYYWAPFVLMGNWK
ncbi:MAG: tetratricopeptide repeat protein [Deltaproteobacteria bacterium]|jgi:CHAT domain-containing protein|nr:tetratricopeptide repeat protein [Deltaproteobacteria bacterium]